ncbi:MAG: glycosyltransferase family 2 protein, partial [Candidatus Aenigmarchaeota archaeon]|nr:glycosyltransferase family 2 protein [Candidatus Aenigmarchaeota archaeon]
MVTIILPTKDEAESVRETIKRIRDIKDYRIVVVDGHSTDGTAEIAKEIGVEIIFDHGLGKGEALRTAFAYADDDVIFTDVDLTYPLEKIPEIEEGLKDHDCVVGYRNSFKAHSVPKIFI